MHYIHYTYNLFHVTALINKDNNHGDLKIKAYKRASIGAEI